MISSAIWCDKHKWVFQRHLVLITPNFKKNHIITFNGVRKKTHHRKSRQKKFWKHARAICHLHSCYMRILSFSAIHKRVIFYGSLLYLNLLQIE